MEYTLLTVEQQQAVLAGHIQQIEQQHASALIQLKRDQAAKRDTKPIKKLIRELELEHAAIIGEK